MGEIDNSAAQAFRRCPREYFESYEAKLEPRPTGEYGPLDIGKRVHELLEEHYLDAELDRFGVEKPVYKTSPNADLEREAQQIMDAYRLQYPSEDFTVVDVERPFRVTLPVLCPKCGKVAKVKGLNAWMDGLLYECEDYFSFPAEPHIYTGKIDLCVRQSNGTLAIIDHKTEKRTSRNNKPEKWAARDQASLYLWAARAIYNEPIESFIVNVLRRPDKKNPPEFPERQKLERTEHQISIAVRDITLIANQIEQFRSQFANNEWPANRENCVGAFGQCSFYTPHLMGWSSDIKRLMYQAKTPYLELAGIPIIQNNS
jgi:PD-(D/E)XK nuclease superfamily